MGYITPEVYKGICHSYNIECPKLLIKTGTFKGGICHRILEENNSELDLTFTKYYTIELDEKICRIASYRYRMFERYGNQITKDLIHSDDEDFSFEGIGQYFNSRLTLFQGDSAEVLSELLSTISQRCAFWLDAHSGAQKYARGIDDCALLRELDAIKSHEIKDHLIAIDDVHLFGQIQYDKKTGEISCDYSEITLDVVEDKIREINPEYKIGVYAPFHMPMIIAYV